MTNKTKKFWDVVGQVIASIIGVILFYLWWTVMGQFLPRP